MMNTSYSLARSTKTVKDFNYSVKYSNIKRKLKMLCFRDIHDPQIMDTTDSLGGSTKGSDILIIL